jgi:photosystem II stability/assembly factor-like uncharacterized protein
MARRFRPGIWLLGVAAGCTLIGGPVPLRGGQQLSLLFSTPLTGGQPARMAVDSQGFIYLAGNTANQNPPAGFVTKLTPSGAVLYTTLLQGARFAGEPGDCLVDIKGIAVDRNGAAYVTGCTSALDFPLVKAFRSTLQGSRTSGFVVKLSPGGTILYSTFFGTGGGFDTGTAIAADDQGNAYVAGMGSGERLPLVNPVQRSGRGFAAKFNASGSALLYSTYLGARPRAIAVDRFGSAYIAGSASPALPVVRPIQACREGHFGDEDDAVVIKLNSSGSSYDYATCLGGSRHDEAMGIAVDASGSAYVVGTTRSVDFPTVRPLDAPPRTGPLWRIDDRGRTWSNLLLDTFSVNTLVASPADVLTWYAGGAEGAFKSNNGGAQWRRLGLPRGEFGIHPSVYRIAMDRRQPSVLYAATSEGLFKSFDDGERWTEIGAALPFQGAFLRGVDVDPFDSQVVYAAGQRGFWKSVDGGTTWRASSQGLPRHPGLGDPFVNTLLVERGTGALYADISIVDRTRSSNRLFKSTDRGATWMPTSVEIAQRSVTALVASQGPRRRTAPRAGSRGDTRSEIEPGAVYIAAQQVFTDGPFGLLLRSDDGGHAWQPIGRGLPRWGPVVLAVAPGKSEQVYAASRGDVFASRDRGETFERVPNVPSFEWVHSLAVDPARAATLLVGVPPTTDVFVVRIRPGGAALEYSTYLGGSVEDVSLGVAVDELGRATVVGRTGSSDFPAVAPLQEPGDGTNGFLSIVDGGGAVLLLSTSVGGPGADSIASAVHAGSRIFIAGGSTDLAGMFPGTGASGAGAFIARLDR